MELYESGTFSDKSRVNVCSHVDNSCTRKNNTKAQAICIARVYNETTKNWAEYWIVDVNNGSMRVVDTESLKAAIRGNRLSVERLTLTSDNKLRACDSVYEIFSEEYKNEIRAKFLNAYNNIKTRHGASANDTAMLKDWLNFLRAEGEELEKLKKHQMNKAIELGLFKLHDYTCSYTREQDEPEKITAMNKGPKINSFESTCERESARQEHYARQRGEAGKRWAREHTVKQNMLDLEKYERQLGFPIYRIGEYKGIPVYCSKKSDISLAYGEKPLAYIVEPKSDQERNNLNKLCKNEIQSKNIFNLFNKKESKLHICFVGNPESLSIDMYLCSLGAVGSPDQAIASMVVYTETIFSIDENTYFSDLSEELKVNGPDVLYKAYRSLQ